MGEVDRRNFITGLTGVLGLAAVSGGAVPFVRSFAPSTDVESQRVVEIDISDVKPGQLKVSEWQGHALFILHRTEEMIEKAKASTAIEPQDDSERVKDPKWLIVDATCQHLGCIPEWNPDGERRAWWCKCHGSEYDHSGRAVRGPTSGNLKVPYYEFLDEGTVRVGKPKKA